MPNSQRGSALILVLIAVLLLSLIGIAGLENTSLETGTNRQFFAEKTALYAAESGLSEGLLQIHSTLKPYNVSFSQSIGNFVMRTGTLEVAAAQPVKAYTNFKAPPPKGISIEMSSEIAATILLWQLTVAAEGNPASANRNIRSARKELTQVVAAFAPEY